MFNVAQPNIFLNKERSFLEGSNINIYFIKIGKVALIIYSSLSSFL